MTQVLYKEGSYTGPSGVPKRVALLGATGSIGTQTLEVISAYPDAFTLSVVSAHTQEDSLLEIAKRFNVPRVALTDPTARRAANRPGIQGLEALLDWVQSDEIDLVVVAMVGFAGLLPVIRALQAKKQVALANKEVLAVAGGLVMGKALANQTPILPIDSEHAGLFQCLQGSMPDEIDRLILTASGGPFLTLPMDQWSTITPEQALKHPRWDMGSKVSIDSATMMNKGLELIEAYWLFEVEAERIDIWVHPQSIVHALVAYVDGSVQAQLSVTDMRLPIQAALTYPDKVAGVVPKLDIAACSNLEFLPHDPVRFPSVDLCRGALQTGGTMLCALSTADEVAVQAFLDGRLGFVDIIPFIASCLDLHQSTEAETYEEVEEVYRETRRCAEGLLKDK